MTGDDDRQSVSLRGPFVDLSNFPTAEPIPAGTTLWRVVSDNHVDEPVWFGCRGTNRFDLHPLGDTGTCYLGLDPAAAIMEAGFRQAGDRVGKLTFTPAMFSNQHLRQLVAPRDLLLADVGATEAGGFGVTRELTTITPMVLSQLWAQALHQRGPDGIDGIVYEPRHALNRQAAAVFGPRGHADDWEAREPIPLTASALRGYLQGTGVTVLEPPQSTGGLTIVE